VSLRGEYRGTRHCCYSWSLTSLALRRLARKAEATTSHPVGPANAEAGGSCQMAILARRGPAGASSPPRTAPLLWLPRDALTSRGFPFSGRNHGGSGRDHSATGGTGGGGDAQGGHISVEARINERIRAPEVRLVGPKGEQIGIVSVNDALKLAQEADLDLVEVAPTARPPVCKLMDYGKFKYESAVKARESRKNQTQTIVKEIKLRPKIDPHDYGTKKGHVERFLKAGDKVKVTIMFRGREQSRPELGRRLLEKLAGDVQELGFVEALPKQDGRNMIMVIGPHKKKSETKGHSATKPVPSPRPAAPRPEAQASPAPRPEAQASPAPRPEAPANSTRPASRQAAAPAGGDSPVAEAAPAADEAVVPGTMS
jgi:translation initiation factor IF-3